MRKRKKKKLKGGGVLLLTMITITWPVCCIPLLAQTKFVDCAR